MDYKVREMLSAQPENTLSTMTEQTDMMMASSISLSEDITKIESMSDSQWKEIFRFE